jgi:hypothetical protein
MGRHPAFNLNLALAFSCDVVNCRHAQLLFASGWALCLMAKTPELQSCASTGDSDMPSTNQRQLQAAPCHGERLCTKAP